MKKLFMLIIIMAILINGYSDKKEFTLLDYFSGEYVSYANTATTDSVDLGFCYMNTTFTEDNIGESIKVKNLEIGQALNDLNANVIDTEYLGGGLVVIYAYSDKINDSVIHKNQKVNLQIANVGDNTIIGWPLILGGF